MSYYGGSISGGKSYCGMGSAYYGGALLSNEKRQQIKKNFKHLFNPNVVLDGGANYYGGKTAYYGGKTAKQQNYQNVIKMVMAQGMTLKQALIHIKKNNLYKK